MLRLWLLLAVTLLLAACGSEPQKLSRKPAGNASTASRTFATPSDFPNFVDHSIGREEISIQAMALVGVPYRWGGNTPDAGFDCSGLVRYVVDRAASVNLPRTTADMSSRGESIEPDGVAPGDLIFFNTTGRPHSHVGIYVGKLRFVNAPSTGGTVRLDYLTNPYWAKRFDGIRRVAPPKSAPTPFDGPVYEASSGAAPLASASPAQIREQSATSANAVEPTTASGAAQRPSRAAGAAVPARTPSQNASAADPFEPPPSALAAAQRQSRDAGATGPARTQPQIEAPSALVARETSATAAIRAQTAVASETPDQFEPPPSSLSAAQRQSRLAASSAASRQQPRAASADPFEPPPAALAAAQRQSRQAASAQTTLPTTLTAAQRQAQSPDPITAAADAFEPPPPTARLAAQQARAAQPAAAPDPAPHVIRASAPADDPIARFANGSN
ncbi:NlpC/P60 family protein [Caballeronia humi]|uniref:Hydrolase Nlp/P60 n=1 Tax=Caballeronia humi TaxID=326474 RepID=A0A158HJ84_9BURK|nr:NlpC/P60 family protein [Caballeronia humi]SAL44366.1 hydrolase Nlp/P60 [Caballeronia humi]